MHGCWQGGRDTDKKVNIVKLVMFNVTRARFSLPASSPLFVFAPLHPLASSVVLHCIHVHLQLAFLEMPYFLSNYLPSFKVAEWRFCTPNTHLRPLVGYSLSVTALEQRDLCPLSFKLSVAGPLLQLDELFCLSESGQSLLPPAASVPQSMP